MVSNQFPFVNTVNACNSVNVMHILAKFQGIAGRERLLGGRDTERMRKVRRAYLDREGINVENETTHTPHICLYCPNSPRPLEVIGSSQGRMFGLGGQLLGGQDCMIGGPTTLLTAGDPRKAMPPGEVTGRRGGRASVAPPMA